MNCLASYRHPRDKLTALLRTKELVRVKKGLYVFGKDYRQRPFSNEVLANLIYGPSYISFEYALGYYGLIPEKVSRITSACLKRNKLLKTPVGEFVYHYLNDQKFPAGITLESIDDNTHFFIATREKALADCLARQTPFSNREELLAYLVDGMRIHSNDIDSFKPDLMMQIASLYQNKNVDLLCKIIQR
jgi:predicted transcriptional regulator of viral defense system